MDIESLARKKAMLVLIVLNKKMFLFPRTTGTFRYWEMVENKDMTKCCPK